jgi:hypothetical protein
VPSKVPSYDVTFIGTGYPTDIGPGSTVVGYELFSSPKAWVYRNGVKTMLPLGGEETGMTVKIADSGVILGSVGNKPAVWEPGPRGYVLKVLPLPANAVAGQATAVAANSAGVVVGNYTSVYDPGGRNLTVNRAFRYDPKESISVGLDGIYGDGVSTVVDMTESGRVLTREGLVLEPNSTTITTYSRVGFVWTLFFASRMNERGEITGIAALPISQVSYQAVKYTPGSGWKVLGGTGSLVSAFDVNSAGDASYLGLYGCGASGYQPELHFEGSGSRCLDGLLVSGSRRWTTAGFPGFTFINDELVVVSLGSNSSTGQYGAVLLSPIFSAQSAAGVAVMDLVASSPGG